MNITTSFTVSMKIIFHSSHAKYASHERAHLAAFVIPFVYTRMKQAALANRFRLYMITRDDTS